jgi:hypothetical protein
LRHACQLIKANTVNARPNFIPKYLVHSSDQGIDLIFRIAHVSIFYVMQKFPLTESTGWVTELEWPQEVGSLLEVGTNGEDLMDQILHADNTILAKAILDNGIVGESDALLVNLSVSALVDELTGGLKVGVSVGDPWLDDLEHLKGGLGHANKNTVVDLEKSEELEDLARLWCDLINTIECELRFWRGIVANSPLDTDYED